MPRPFKSRNVRGKPNSNYFKPAGIPKSELEEVELTIEEFESIRLIYSQELSQGEASEKMGISQPTFSRILTSGIKKIADSIIKGKAIKIR